MLDPLTALGLAGNVIQMVQFTGQLATQAREIRSTGSSRVLQDVRTITYDLLKQIETTKKIFGEDESVQTARNEEDQQLVNLINDCESSGLELVSSLRALPCTPLPSRWQTIRTTAKIAQSKSKIEGYMKRLEALRNALSFHVVVALKKANQEQSARTDQKLAALQEDISTVVHMFEDRSGNLQQLAAQHSDVVEWCVDVSSSATGPRQATDQDDVGFSEEFEGLLGRRKNGSLSSLEFTPQRLAMMRKRKAILDLLQFRQIDDRFDEVDEAYKETFEWIFDAPVAADALPWDDFSTFLRDSAVTRPYWINGKAGSGKSTLMKHIFCDSRTQRSLKVWAGERDLQVAQFFSWNLGSTMQKSYLGVLQTFLYHILLRRQGLIRQVFPDLWHTIHSDAASPLSNAEVKRAFSRLVNLPDKPFKTCLFIDGIDEFDENHYELSSFLKELAAPHFKLVVSSRPIPACAEVFEDCPKLRLQDLTYTDIETYVNGKLRHDTNMLLIADDEPEIVELLVREVTDMASGVFLWVKLAVSSLLSGVRAGDQGSDLQERLRALPPDLENLFKHMLSKMDPMHQRQASEMFQIVRKGLEMADRQPLTALAVSFASKDPSACLQASMHSLEATRALRQVHRLQKQLRSRCCGLVETHVKTRPTKPPFILVSADALSVGDLNIINSNVQYLHRTVAEYLHRDEVWEDFLSLTPQNSFSVYKHISHMALYMLKIIPLKEDARSNKSLWHWAGILISCERSVQELDRVARVDVLDAFDMALTYHWGYKRVVVHEKRNLLQKGVKAGSTTAAAFLVEDKPEEIVKSHWSSHISFRLTPECVPKSLPRIWLPHSFFQLAVCAGLREYVVAKLEHSSQTHPGAAPPNPDLLLYAAFPQRESPWGSSLEAQTDMVIILLSHGADPTSPICLSASFWTILLERLLRDDSDSDSSRLPWLRVMEYCLICGADPNASILFSGFSYSALQIVRLGAAYGRREPPTSRTRSRCPRDEAAEQQKIKDSKAVVELSAKLEGILKDRGARDLDGEGRLAQLDHFFTWIR